MKLKTVPNTSKTACCTKTRQNVTLSAFTGVKCSGVWRI